MIGHFPLLLTFAAASAAFEPAAIVVNPSSCERELRGDWETPQAVVIAYLPAWKNALRDIVGELSANLPLYVLVKDDLEARAEMAELGGDLAVQFIVTSNDTPWVRDFGPIQVRSKTSASLWLDAEYTGARPGDDSTPRHLAPYFGAAVETLARPLDGGALVSNGKGLCALTRSNLEQMGLQEEDANLPTTMATLGCKVLVVLPPLIGETTGHADLFVHFFASNRVGVGELDHKRHPDNAKRLDEAAKALRRGAALLDLDLAVFRVPMRVRDDNTFYTYLNVLNLSDKILVPHYRNVPAREEKRIYRILSTASGKPPVSIAADEMIELGGAIHCMALGIY